MSYKIRKINGKIAVVEEQTKLIMQFFSENKEAQKLANKLNKGLGFNGWSPTFITTRERV